MPEATIPATAQLSFGLGNPDAPGTIFVSSDPADNKLTLTMSATVAAAFTAGTMVPPDQAQNGSGSLLYLYLSPLGLTDAEFKALKLVSEGWSATLYSGESGQYIGFTPTAPVSLQPAPAEISFALNGFTLAQAPGNSATLYVLAYRVSGISTNFPSSSNIGVVFAMPDNNTGDLTTAMTPSLSPGQVVNSISGYPAIANQLVLSFAQQPNAPRIKSGADTAFTLNFVFATNVNGYGALLNVEEAKQLAVTAAQGTTNWQIDRHMDADPPFWTLTPPPNTPLFTDGPGSTFAFDIGNLVTMFQPGPTAVLIGYSNVPGYKNGSFALTLVKAPHVVISSFAATPQQSVLANGQAKVTLSWQTTNATQLTLQPIGADVTGTTSFDATISDTTQFTLVAEGQRPGNVDNVASQSVLAQVLPVINSFTASPTSIYVGDFGTGYPTNLAWNVNTNESVTLSSSTTGPLGGLYPAASSVQQPLSTPQMLTLTPKGGSQDPTVSRSLIVSGFGIAAQQASIGNDSGFCAAPANADFVAVTAPQGNLVSILSTANYAAVTTVPTGKHPLGIAFSPDGTLMYVANSGDGTVSVFAVAATQSSPPFSFTPAATVQVGGAPQSVVVGPNGTAWVTIDLGTGKAGQAVPITVSNGQFSAGTAVTIGQGPRAAALSPSGASLYVPCSGDGTVWMVTVTGGAPAAGRILTGIGNPVAAAVTPDGKKLLIAAQGDGAVYVYNSQTPATSPRQTLAVPGATGLAMFPTGDYALATGSGPNAALLLNYATASVSASEPLPAAPLSAAVTPEGGLAFISLPGTNSIEVITFAQYAQVAATTAAGGQITNVAVSSDNQSVIGWSDATIGTVTGGNSKPLTGIVKGPVSGIVLTPYLAGTAINWAAFSPVAADDALYVAPHGAAEIRVYQFSTMAALATIPIQGNGPAGRQPVVLGLSPDGTTLFALVADNTTQYSMVIVDCDVHAKSFSVAADFVVYTASVRQLTTPLAVVPTASGYASAWTVDTTTNNLWQVSYANGSWQAASQPIALAPGNSGASASAMACSPDGSTAYVALTQMVTNYIAVADLTAGTAQLIELPASTMTMNLTALAVSADGQSLYASDVAAAGIRIFDAQSLRIAQTMTWQSNVQSPWGIAATSNGTSLFSANTNSQNIAIAQQLAPT